MLIRYMLFELPSFRALIVPNAPVEGCATIIPAPRAAGIARVTLFTIEVTLSDTSTINESGLLTVPAVLIARAMHENDPPLVGIPDISPLIVSAVTPLGSEQEPVPSEPEKSK
jgi:hypothetical protein